MPSNPYTLLFGKEPSQMIPRPVQMAEVVDAFSVEVPGQQVFMITGVRGAGKTVFMTDIARQFREKADWIVVELNPERDMLQSLASKLSSNHGLAKLFQSAKINLSFFGFGLEVGNSVQITDIETALSKMLETLHKHRKRVLVTVDEVVNTKEMRVFASAFQILIRQNAPLFLLMTGLYENIHSLQEEKSLTFLYRAPRIDLKPLHLRTMAENYQRNLRLGEDTAMAMARQTKGYSFAFQVLGYFSWQYGGPTEEVKGLYRQYLDEYVYDKIWSELSQGDRRLAWGIAKAQDEKVSTIRQLLHMETNQFNPYRKRLVKKGLVDGSKYGCLFFTLPLFDKFVLDNYEESVTEI